MDPTSIRYQLDKALHLARPAGRVPSGSTSRSTSRAPRSTRPSSRASTLDRAPARVDGAAWREQVGKTIELLNAAERPVLLVGNGVRLAGAAEPLLRLVDALDIPVLTTWLAADLLSETHPCTSAARHRGVARGELHAPELRPAHVDRGPARHGAHRLRSTAVRARGQEGHGRHRPGGDRGSLEPPVDVPDLRRRARPSSAELLAAGPDRLEPPDRQAWLRRCTDWKEKYPVVLPEYWRHGRTTSTSTPSRASSRELAGDDLIIPGSSGAASRSSCSPSRSRRGSDLFTPAAWARWASACRRASAAAWPAAGSGRSASTATAASSSTSRSWRPWRGSSLPIKFFVINNEGYASIRASQNNYFQGHLVAADATSGLTLPDLLKVAAAYGLTTARIADQRRTRGRVRDVLACPGRSSARSWSSPTRRSARGSPRQSPGRQHGQSDRSRTCGRSSTGTSSART